MAGRMEKMNKYIEKVGIRKGYKAKVPIPNILNTFMIIQTYNKSNFQHRFNEEY
jgi:hypothetical protein